MNQGKPCDWICTSCKNLNYSFRKYCNRCQQCTRDVVGTRFIQNRIVTPQTCLIDSLKLESNNLTGSNHSTASSVDDVDRENVVFSQALFLEDLSKTGDAVQKQFPFMKTCSLCSTSNYFYQSKCSQCNFSNFY